MVDVLLVALLALVVLSVALLFGLSRRVSAGVAASLASRLDALDKAQERTERTVREEVLQSRDEIGKGAREQRRELAEAVTSFGDSLMQRVGESARLQQGQLETFFGNTATITRTQLEGMNATIARLSDATESRMEALRVAMEARLERMQIDNGKQLEQMRQTVDEKLQGTLEKRLGESFRQVSERLELVHRGLGEMQNLATGVGDLKKVLTNVKTRGTWGEVQLGVLLEQVLNPDQFATNVATTGGGERVEFAIKLPGHGADGDGVVWLPIDAKFPIEDYQRLIEAQEKSDPDACELAGKQLENRVRACARDISTKYLGPPKTTDFGILFLPIEGLFAEVIRRTGLAESIQRDHRVILAGPTTLWSILNSLQMGFRTLAIQKRSSEVWNLLAAVKTEWAKYGDVLDAVQKKLTQASDAIDKAKIRSRAVGKKLANVEQLPAGDASVLLPLEASIADVTEDE